MAAFAGDSAWTMSQFPPLSCDHRSGKTASVSSGEVVMSQTRVDGLSIDKKMLLQSLL